MTRDEQAYAEYVRMCEEVWRCPPASRSKYDKEHKPFDTPVNVDAVLRTNKKRSLKRAINRHP